MELIFLPVGDLLLFCHCGHRNLPQRNYKYSDQQHSVRFRDVSRLYYHWINERMTFIALGLLFSCFD